MTRYAYTAIPVQQASGGVVSGSGEALDERALRDQLRMQGLIAIDVRPVSLRDAMRGLLSADRIRRSDSVWFFQTLRMLLENKVPVESALGNMSELAGNARLRGVCAEIRDALRSGSSLAGAVAEHPGLASAQHVALLRSGHESGRLEHVVTLIDQSLSHADRLRRSVINRLVYPVILVIVSILLVWFLATFVIPRFAETLASLGGELHWATSLTMWLAGWLVWVIPPALILGGVAFAFRNVLVPQEVKVRLAQLAMRTPIVGSLIWHGQGGVITDVTATMIEGGGDVLSGLTQAHEVVSSPVIAERLNAARQEVREGVDIGEALSAHKVLPPMVAAVVRVGMKGGDLVGALRRATAICVDKQEQVTQRLLTFMEPLIILFLAGTVGWVVFSLIMGIVSMNELEGL